MDRIVCSSSFAGAECSGPVKAGSPSRKMSWKRSRVRVSKECKREVARNPGDHRPAGGIWQGLNSQTGAVASAVWVKSPDQSLVFIEIDGRPLGG